MMKITTNNKMLCKYFTTIIFCTETLSDFTTLRDLRLSIKLNPIAKKLNQLKCIVKMFINEHGKAEKVNKLFSRSDLLGHAVTSTSSALYILESSKKVIWR